LQRQGGRFDVVTLHRNFTHDTVFKTCRPLTGGFSLGRIAPMQTGAVGYIITRTAAKNSSASPRQNFQGPPLASGGARNCGSPSKKAG
jgi:hypothetical protein